VNRTGDQDAAGELALTTDFFDQDLDRSDKLGTDLAQDIDALRDAFVKAASDTRAHRGDNAGPGTVLSSVPLTAC
jgi:hypothetical protein